MLRLTILIYGQSGSGKEVFAQSIHNESSRRNKPFVVINCAALPESILESILFGYEAVTFTGAKAGGKAGLFELAHGGTVFLDEVSEMPLNTQSRFLRVLQEREVMRIGSDRPMPVDIRVIAATNKDIVKLTNLGDFREDLYFRLNVLKLDIPPLCKRKEDIEQLSKFFINYRSNELGITITQITNQAIAYLSSLDLPGNIRQLDNILERAIVLSSNGIIDQNLIQSVCDPFEEKKESKVMANPQQSYKAGISSFEKEAIEKALSSCNNNRKQTAEKLGISYPTLWRKMKLFEIG